MDMDPSKQLDLESLMIDKLQGRLTLLQPEKEKEATVLDALEAVLRSDQGTAFRAEFEASPAEKMIQMVKDFLSYGLIDDLMGTPRSRISSSILLKPFISIMPRGDLSQLASDFQITRN